MLKSDYCSEETKEYLYAYFEANKFSALTKVEVEKTISKICDFCGKDFLDIDRVDSEKFYRDMVDRGLTASTTNSIWSRCRKFATYLYKNSELIDYVSPFSDTILEKVPVRVNTNRIVGTSEVDKILEAAKDNLMVYVILSMAFRIAVSSSDFINLKKENVKFLEDGALLYFPKKHLHKEQVIPLPDDIAKLLKLYMDNQPYYDSEGHLFYNKWKSPLTMRNLDALVEKYRKAAGVEKYTLKDLRSRAILDMINATQDNGGDIGSVGEYVRLHGLRLNAYVTASGAIRNECPANLVNISVCIPDMEKISNV